MKYIFIDVDGTIIDHKTNSIPQSTINTINELYNNGHKLFISSGRDKKILVTGVDIDYSGYVCSLGTDVYYDGEEVINEPFSDNEVKKITKIANKYDIKLSYECKENGFSSEYLYDRVYKSEESSKVFQGNYKYWLKLDEYDNSPVYKMMAETVLDNKENFEKFNEEIKDVADPYPSTFNNLCSEEVCHKGYSKGAAIKKLAELGIIDIKDTIAIGDSSNDISMLEVANIGIIMGQANDELKSKADIITDDIANDGFYKAFKALALVK